MTHPKKHTTLTSLLRSDYVGNTLVRALTIRQPFANLIVEGRKHFETRGRRPPLACIGERIAIHAGKHRSAAMLRACIDVTPGGARVAEHARHVDVIRDDGGFVRRFPLGAVIGSATLVNAGRIVEEVGDGVLYVSWVRPLPFIRRPNPYVYPHPPDNLAFERTVGFYGVGRWLWKFAGAGMKPYPIPAIGYQNFWNWEES